MRTNSKTSKCRKQTPLPLVPNGKLTAGGFAGLHLAWSYAYYNKVNMYGTSSDSNSMHLGPLSPHLPAHKFVGGAGSHWCLRCNRSSSLQASPTCKYQVIRTGNINRKVGHASVISNFKTMEETQGRSRKDDRKEHQIPLMHPFDPFYWSDFFSEITFILLNGRKTLILPLNSHR